MTSFLTQTRTLMPS